MNSLKRLKKHCNNVLVKIIKIIVREKPGKKEKVVGSYLSFSLTFLDFLRDILDQLNEL